MNLHIESRGGVKLWERRRKQVSSVFAKSGTSGKDLGEEAPSRRVQKGKVYPDINDDVSIK